MIKSKYVFLVTDVSQLKPVSDYILKHSPDASASLTNDGMLSWVSMYDGSRSHYSLPAYIGFHCVISAHVSLNGESPEVVFAKYFKGLTLLPLDYIDHPDDYPELFI